MTYAGFLLLFLILPLVILVIFLRKRLLNRRYLFVVGILTAVAIMYMAPWDHFAATWGLWSWESSRTWGIRWWAIPPEEYLFCILEALLAITLTFAVLTKKDKQNTRSISKPIENWSSVKTNFVPSSESNTLDKSIVSTSSSPTLNERTDHKDKP